MWARFVRPPGRPVYRTLRFSRKYGGAANNGPHTTYFQPPPKPPRRIFRSILLGTTCIGLGAYAHSWLYDLPFLAVGLDVLDEGMIPPGLEMETMEEAMATAVQAAAAMQTPPMDLSRAQEMLETRSGYSVTSKAVAHTAQLPSNLPCEDTWSSGAFTFFNDPAKDWCEWAIFDGHAGPRTSEILRQVLPSIVGDELAKRDCLDRPYMPNDSRIIDAIKKAFLTVDREILNQAREHIEFQKGGRAQTIAVAAAAHSGSCALLTLFDPARSVLRVANTGDSRAVLGRWDKESAEYTAQPMSTDQTGFNSSEVARLKRDHPGEDPVDLETGRLHGLAVTRAFGDARWKWPSEITRRAHELFCGPPPRPNEVIKTPPYMSAEPEVTETKVRSGAHPDFLIMASDGFWDNMSSQDAVTCVQMWLEKNRPTNFLEKTKEDGLFSSLAGNSTALGQTSSSTFSSISDLSGEDDDTYYDADEKCLKWRVSPRHFINEDQNCGIHLVKNALGGKRRDLYTGVMSVQPPLSRRIRDDITVHVIFFGVDTETFEK